MGGGWGTIPLWGGGGLGSGIRTHIWAIISKNPKVEHNKYHAYTVRGTPPCPLNPKDPWVFCVVFYRLLPGPSSLGALHASVTTGVNENCSIP